MNILSIQWALRFTGLAIALLCCAAVSTAVAAAPSAALLKAKKDAEAKGYIFETSHDEIVAKAKKEGRLRVASTLDPDVNKAMSAAFKKKYPFIDLRLQELGSVEENQRFLLEIKAGAAKGWDVNRVYTDFYEEYLPYEKKFDILAMAEHKILNIPPALVDPRVRNVVTVSSNMTVIAYNKKLLPEDKVPAQWEDFLKPEFKGRKFAADVRPLPFAMLVPAWGLEKTAEFAKNVAAQDPIYGRGHTRIIASVANGEYPLFLGPNLGAVKRAQQKDKIGALGMRLVEPVPTRLHEGNAVLNTADHPYAGLLWLEFMASPEGQAIMDKEWPLGASVFSPGSEQEKLTKGKKLSVIDWNHYGKLDDYLKRMVEAMGFPKAK
ncbi:MAG TPA: extracellular solute-binding protein [Candidatus Acidoferrales bacterium]|nr:extracellular solute-binding protein [Candidatus Acidoferrales bacterium]